MRITENSAFITDLYELTMAAGYFDNRIDKAAVFELFVRDMPPDRGYLLLAGMETALGYLEELHFTPDEVSYLRGLEVFKNVSDDFFDYLGSFKFECDVWAMPEGTAFFSNEPVLRVSGPIIQAQVVETFLLTAVTFESMVATKAARVVEAAKGRPVADFGSRRAHGPEAAVRAARASYIGGCASTSNVYAGMRLGIPVTGTAAHSWIMAHDSEIEAFENYFRVFPDHTTLLIDSYDTIEGARRATGIGPKVRGVRIDSGDIVEQSKQVRNILDDADMTETKIVASGDLDEYEIERLLDAGALLDMFGVGTKMVTSADAPHLGGVYKLVEVADGGEAHYRAKFSEGKVTYPGSKQVWRQTDKDGFFEKDMISMSDEKIEGADSLLEPVMEKGRIVIPKPSIGDVRDRAKDQIQCLKEEYRKFRNPEVYPVGITKKITRALEELKQKQLGK